MTFETEGDLKFQEALSKAVSITGWLKRLLPHELALYNSGELQNITHHGSSSIWLEAPSSSPPTGRTNVYRPMGDREVTYLVEHGELPDTQAYQAIIEGENGRLYANKYLTGAKSVSTHPTTIVEFSVPTELIEILKQKQMKIEDGALSMGLGDKAGKGLPLFNENHQNLLYCRRPTGPIPLRRNKMLQQCYHNGTPHSFISLVSNNITASTVLHQWKSSIEKAEQYAHYITQQIKLVEDDKMYLCECIHPQSFGKECEYLLPINNSTFEATLDWEFRMKFFNLEEMEKYGDTVCYTTLICDFGLLCLDWRDICDGLQQCMYGYDEENCDILEFNECEDDEYRCMNGMCIPDEYFLDGDYDCMDLTDEKDSFNDIDCTFQQANLECDDRVCLPNQWSCGDGQCIKNRLIFQQLQLLEHVCNNRRDQLYMCETGAVYKRWTLLNGRCDVFKEYEEFAVPDGDSDQLCIRYLKCYLTDGAMVNCICGYDSFCLILIRLLCLQAFYFPKGKVIAPYVTNIHMNVETRSLEFPVGFELNGAIKCRGFQVERRMFISYPAKLDLLNFEFQLCDNSSHEFVPMDEGYDLNCHNDSLTANNHRYHFIDVCNRSKECISAYRIKDGIRNCADGLDEEQSGNVVVNACSRMRRHRFRCSIDEPTCLFANTLGDRNPDCKNRHDELWMDRNSALSEMNCNRQLKKDCQLIRQYIEASWNADVSMTDSQQSSTTKIPFRRYCDTFYDLGSKKDEDANICQKWWKCLDEQWQCRTGQCINVTWVLDGEWDCNDASDEETLFAFNHTILPRNLELINIIVLMKKFIDMYSIQPFFNICNFSTEYPCFRTNINDSLADVTKNRPCISLQQIGDGHIDCIGGEDERNTIQHCTNPSTLGRDFMCLSSKTCITEFAMCLYSCPDPSDNHFLCKNREKSSMCNGEMYALCLNGTCVSDGKCNKKYDCLYGEDEYMCEPVKLVISTVDGVFYRERKQRETKKLQHIFQLPRLPLDINRVMRTDLPSSFVRNTTAIVHSIISTDLPLPYVCNRGVGVLTYNSLMVCFCPPQYYGIKCEFHSDRVTVILHLNLSKSTYSELTNPKLLLKLLVLFLFENQTLDTHEFHVRPAMESISYKKLIHHFLYSRSNRSLDNKRMRYFNRSEIINEHLYAIRIESYELNINERAQLIAVWQYPIYFDYLPSFRFSKVLTLIISNNMYNPCSSNPCAPSEQCHQLQNQRSTYICLCPTNFTGTNCSVLDPTCANDFCSSHGLCKPTYRSLLNGNKMPYCVCSLNTFGRRCDLLNDNCIQNPCQNNGTCLTTEKPNDFLCICNNRYYGLSCELEKQTVHLYLNGSIIHAGAVVQYFKLNFISLDLILVHQRVFKSLPDVIFTFHDVDRVPEVILIKFYFNKHIKIHLVLLQFNVTSINATIQLTEKDQCMPVTTLWSITEEIFPIKYHSLCINDSNLLCFHDKEYLCICSEQNIRVECFDYDHYLEQCSRCLAGGQCLQEDRLRIRDFICLCPRCYRGSLCQFNTEIQSFSLDSLFADIHFSVALLYLILVFLICVIGAVTNYATFVTFKRPKSRKLGVGSYLLFISLLSQCSLLALFGKTIQNLFKSTLNNISCKILSYMLSVFTRCSFWLISWVTLERLFVVLFPFNNLWKKPCFARTTICITFILICSMHVHDLIFYIVVEDSNGQMVCVGNFTKNFSNYNRITLIVHYIIPFSIQIVSITILIIVTAHSHSRTTKNNKKTFIQVLKQQFNSQKELYIIPLIIILSSLPHGIFSFIFACAELSVWQRHTLLTAYFLSYTPQLLGFVLFVLPSTSFSNEFRETQLAKQCLFKWLLSRK